MEEILRNLIHDFNLPTDLGGTLDYDEPTYALDRLDDE